MFLEGSREFDVIWGTLTGLLCLALAVPVLWWWLPDHRRSFFGTRIDPTYRLQLAYGLFSMAMFGTNIGCRYIPHGFLEYVHPTFALITLILILTLTPRIAYLAFAARRDRTLSMQ
ncbi:MAG: hypothetical protein NVSMB5_21300 [Candidatus Velthaea sp.]